MAVVLRNTCNNKIRVALRLNVIRSAGAILSTTMLMVVGFFSSPLLSAVCVICPRRCAGIERT